MVLIAGIILTLIHAYPVRSQIPNLIDPNSSRQFFEEGQEQLEKEIKWLQTEEIPSEKILQLESTAIEERKLISVKEIQGWCIDSEGKVNLTGSDQPEITVEESNQIILDCY